MKLSKFFTVVQIEDDVFAVYNRLVMDVLFVTREELTKIQNLHFETKLLKSKGIYVENDSTDELAYERLKEQYFKESTNLHIMYLILTTSCNLACKYCYIENNVCNNKIEHNMSEATAHLAIERYIEHLKNVGLKEAEIILYGGEPLTNWSCVKEIAKYTKKMTENTGINVVVSMVTNGTLLDEEKANFIAEYGIKVGISIDGPKEINDENRIYRASDKSVYDRVLHTVDLLNSKGIDFGFSITLSDTFIKNKEDVIEWLKNMKVNGIAYNLYHFSTDDGCWKKTYENQSDFLIESFEKLYVAKGLVEDRQFRKLESFKDSRFKFSDCASVGCNQITVRPDGILSICHCYSKTDKYVIGNIYDMTFDEAVKSQEATFWKYRSPIFNEECLQCEGIFICGGGCPAQGEALFGGRKEIDKPFCIHTKKSLVWLLKKLYENS